MFDYPDAIRQPTVFSMSDGWRACIWLAERGRPRLIVGEAETADDAIALAIRKARGSLQ